MPGRPVTMPVPNLQYLQRVNAMISLLSARMLGLLAVLGAIGIFGFAIYDPSQIRAATAGLYACGVLWPLVYLYLRKDLAE